MIERDSLSRSPHSIVNALLKPMFELDRLHSQALAQFGLRKLAMSLLGGAGEWLAELIL